jgi:pilus assembly protein CpaB
MRPVRIVILVTAAIAAIALALMVRGMMGSKAPAGQVAAAPVEKPMSQVLVASRDLPIGTRLSAADMRWQDWPQEALNATFVTSGPAAPPAKGAAKIVKTATAAAEQIASGGAPMQAFEGALVKEPIAAGEPMTARKIVRGGEGGYMAVVLHPGMRAISIPVSTETGAGGFILPGDRVDVMQAKANEGNKGFTTQVLLSDVRVLAIDQATEPAKDATSLVGAVATLEVAADAAQLVAQAKAQGEIILALRSYADLGAGAPAAVRAAGETVRIFRSGQVSEVAVR